jgi:predicted DNA-binding protein (MmcQ/YjbR family)
MTMPVQTVEALRKLALKLPEATEGVACEGTAAEKRTVQVRDKAFLFLGQDDAMVKLRESLAHATKLMFEQPLRFKVGAHGWVTVTLADEGGPPLDLLERWVAESHRLVAPKSLTSRPPPPPPASEPKPKAKAQPAAAKPAKKKSKKKS